MRKSIQSLLATFALFAAFTACGPAYGQIVTTTYGPFTVNCTPVGQLCNNVFAQSVTTISTLQVEYVASPGHCSNVRAHILVDGVEKALTAFLTPGQASGFFNVGPVTPGSHVVALQGEGIVGGCNTGILAGWGGTMLVMTDSPAVPTVSMPLLWLLSASLALVAGLVMRRRLQRRS